MEHKVFHVTDHIGKTHEVHAKDAMDAKKKVVDHNSTYVPGGVPLSKWGKVQVKLQEAANFMTTYRRNESQNRHAQNVVHLAKHYGSEADQKEAQFYVDELKKHGHNAHAEASYKLHQKLWPKAVSANKLEERVLTPAETAKKEEIVKSMKKKKVGFRERYGKRAKEVMYATATKQAKKVAEESDTLSTVKDVLNEVFTRKHFRQVADIIKNHPDAQKRKELASHHSEIFAKSNPRFDKKRFYDAAGVNEEVEQLDELSTDKLQWYTKHAAKQIAKGKVPLSKYDREKVSRGHNPFALKFGKTFRRIEGLAKGLGKLREKGVNVDESTAVEQQLAKEEVDNLDEGHVIVSTHEKDDETGHPLYWHNTDGWVDKKSATKFSDKHKAKIPYLPHKSKWEKLKESNGEEHV